MRAGRSTALRAAAAVGVAAAALSLAGAAAGAPRSGAVGDPLDVPPPPDLPEVQPADVRSLGASYDPETGAIGVTLELHNPLSPWINRDVDMGFGPMGADGTCAAPAVPWDPLAAGPARPLVELDIYSDYQRGWWDFLATGNVRLGSYDIVAQGPGTLSDDRRTITFSIPATPALEGLDLRCVGPTVAFAVSGPARDDVASFVFDGFAPAPRPVAPPPERVAGPPQGPAAPSALPGATASMAPDRHPPRVRLSAARRSLGALRTGGLPVRVTSSEDAAVAARLTLPATTARRFGVPRIIGTAPTTMAAASRRAVTAVRLKPWARRLLAGRRVLRARLEVVVRDASGNTKVAARMVTFRR
ncbi:hypothetical protein [Miltoncostaea marina]|uniref:hypothetical protein n=1 Tax=Miltoncostaea marina TaxID=2843215 RepID=UPI001C3D3AA0|nr:hypothetical protein [Miltoncostaea marina]